MHASSLENMYKCFSRYIDNDFFYKKNIISVIDIGGSNVNGSYKEIFTDAKFDFKIVDISDAPDVDIVLESPYKLPLDDGSIDIIISGQTFEHVEFFWLLFEEMVRVIKNDGFILLIAPSSGPEHKYPVDCYRFYPDSYKALAKYTNCLLVDWWIDEKGPWKDLVGIFSKIPMNKNKCQFKSNNFFQCKYSEHFSPQNQQVVQTPEIELIQGNTNYLEVLKWIHNERKPDLYCEIGVRKGNSLSVSKSNSIAIDPVPDLSFNSPPNVSFFQCTSDDFFEYYAKKTLNNRIDLAFIDGMHLFEFVLRDFINIEKYAKHNTIIVIDDILPNNTIQASRERQSRVWTGDVWKIQYCLKKYRPELKMLVLNTVPTGLLLVTGLNQNNNVLMQNYNPIVNYFKKLKINDYCEEVFKRQYAKNFDLAVLNQFLNS